MSRANANANANANSNSAASIRARLLHLAKAQGFAYDSSRQSLWQAFLKKNALPALPLPATVVRLRSALAPALADAIKGTPLPPSEAPAWLHPDWQTQQR